MVSALNAMTGQAPGLPAQTERGLGRRAGRGSGTGITRGWSGLADLDRAREPGLEPGLRALDGRQLGTKIVAATLVVLVLVQVFGIALAGFCTLVSFKRAVTVQRRK